VFELNERAVRLLLHAEVQDRRGLELREHGRLDAGGIVAPLPERLGIELRLEGGLIRRFAGLFRRIIVRDADGVFTKPRQSIAPTAWSMRPLTSCAPMSHAGLPPCPTDRPGMRHRLMRVEALLTID
jgi:hypothetical protein